MTTLTIKVTEEDGAFIAKKETNGTDRDLGKNTFREYAELVRNIERLCKSVMYSTVRVQSGDSALNSPTLTIRKAEQRYVLQVKGPFGQCREMYKLRDDLEPLLN